MHVAAEDNYSKLFSFTKAKVRLQIKIGAPPSCVRNIAVQQLGTRLLNNKIYIYMKTKNGAKSSILNP